jgi:DNA-directed RNA polymerase specialized sigma24 family protein
MALGQPAFDRGRMSDKSQGGEHVTLDEELAKIVELRFFGGLEHDEIAAVLGVSNVTVRRRFRIAKAWLYRRLSGREPEGGG